MANPTGSDKEQRSKQPDFVKYTGLGFQFLLTIGVLGYLGYLLDLRLNTLPLFMVVFIMIALTGNIVLLIRAGRER